MNIAHPITPGAEQPDLKEQLRVSLILAALENLMKYDTDPRLRAEVRRRYLNLTAEVQP